ncbi:MAG TPA: autotransporter-associated beta strand repeat-containing protein, partial [Allosphingosinicella sp.]
MTIQAGFSDTYTAVGSRARGARLLRGTLLGSSALIGVASASPALAQVSTNPAGGGTITTTSGTFSNDTASGGGVSYSGPAAVTIDGVQITNVTGSPTPDAFNMEASGTAVLINRGINQLTTNVNGGAALYIGANNTVSWAPSQNDSTSRVDLTGSYGLYLLARNGNATVAEGNNGGLRNITANGSAIAGIYASATQIAGVTLLAPNISGFGIGIDLVAARATATLYGGSISATQTGLRATASGSGGEVVLYSGAAITAPTGISATSASGPVTVATLTGGTINSNAAGTGTGIYVRSGGSTSVTVGANIGVGTTFATVVDAAAGSGTTGNQVNINSLVRGSAGLVVGTGAFTTTLSASGTIEAVGVNGAGVLDSGGGTVLNQGGTITAQGAAVQFTAGGAVTNSGVMSGRWGIYATGGALNVNNASSVVGRTDGINMQPGSGALTLNNSGTIETENGAGSAAGIYMNTAAAHTITNSGTITGGTDGTFGYGVSIDTGTLTLNNNSGGVIGGGAGGIRLSSTGAQTVNLNAGSTVNGAILADDTGARTVTIAGALNGAYNAGTGSGVDTVTLASGGSITGNVLLGGGEDTFTWNGGTIAGSLDGGTGGLNNLIVNLGVGVSRTLNGFTNFFSNSNALTSGTLTITGTVSNVSQFAISGGGKLIFDTSFNAGGANYALLNTNGTLEIASGRTLTGGNVVSQRGTLINSGTLNGNGSAGAAAAYNGVVVSNSGVTVTNNGTIQNSNANYSTGFWLRSGTNSITNNGLIAGGLPGTAFITNGVRVEGGVASVTNDALGIIRGGEGGIVTYNSGGVNLVNSGYVVGTTDAIKAAGSGTVSIINNAGATIGTGSITDSGVYTSGGGTGAAITLAAGGTITNLAGGSVRGYLFGVHSAGAGTLRVDNAGLITSITGDGVRGSGSGAVTVINRSGGTISTSGNNNNSNAVYVNTGQALTVVNAGSISSALNAGVAGQGNAGLLTVTNATGGTIQGGSSIYGQAVQLNSTSGSVLNNYGAIAGGAGTPDAVNSQNNNYTVNLFAGSTLTGGITLGSGNDTLAIYNGRGTAATATVDVPNGITLQNAGTLAAATFGAVNLGGGSDTLRLRGTGDGTAANGTAGSFSIAISTGAEVLAKTDTGTWTLTGAAITPAITINAGDGGNNDGLLVFNGTTGLTGAINVNGAIIRAATAGAFGTGTITTIDPTIQYGATGTYSNNIVLASADPVNDPTRIQVDGGVTATLTGQISQSGPTPQPLVFDGAGTTILTNGSNTYAGLTTISNGTVVERNTGSALGSGGVTINAGAVLQFDTTDSSLNVMEAGTYGGGGTLRFTSSGGGGTVAGSAGNVIISLSSGGLIDVASGTFNASGAGQGFFTGNRGDLNIASGATFDTVEGTVQVDALTGAGILQGGFGGPSIITVGVDGGSGTFSGTIRNSPVAGGAPRILGLTKVGSGTQTLTGIGTYTGGTTITGGTLAVQGGSALADGGTVTVNAPATFAVISSEAIGTLTGSGSTTITANQNLTLINASGTYTGSVSGGVLTQLGGNWTFGGTRASPGSSAFNLMGGTLNVAATGSIQGGEFIGVRIDQPATLNNLGSITNTGAGGSGAASSGVGVFAGAGTTTITNGSALNSSALISGSIAGILHESNAAGALVVANYGRIYGNLYNGIENRTGAGALTVTNYAGGVIHGELNAGSGAGHGIYQAGTTLLTVDNAGTLVGSTYGIYTAGAAAITNSGLIGAGSLSGQASGSYTAGGTTGIIARGGTVTNNAGGLIQGGSRGIELFGATGIVNNSGSITSGTADVVFLSAGGTVNNLAGGALTSGNRGVAISGGTGTLNNAGTIISQEVASILFAGGSVTNQPGGLIRGEIRAVNIQGGSGTVTNSGTIEALSNAGGYGIFLGTGGTVTNHSGGVIRGGFRGVQVQGGTATVTNSGTIHGFGAGLSYGIILLGGGSVTNNADSLIRGTYRGVSIQ